ncbi:hypothetical protein WJX73_000012 [Symbiochloris irregularis]|uniref:F-box domain-containing protein n=1 Tax=Symbiochloris irregularis TaxID=706552 RepID=A0AAW1NTX3_9CHLO
MPITSSPAQAPPKHDLWSCGEFQQIIGPMVLQSLSLRDLASLACSCVALRDLAYRDAAIRVREAGKHLPPRHPALVPGASVQDVQAAMRRQAAAAKNLLDGSSAGSVSHNWPEDSTFGSLRWAGFSRDGTRLALLTERRIALFDTQSCQPIWNKTLAYQESVLGIGWNSLADVGYDKFAGHERAECD